MILAILPLRLASTRIPQKPLADIGGLSLACRTVARTLDAFAGDPSVRVIAAVDDETTSLHLIQKFPRLEVIKTAPSLPSGTDRVHAATELVLKRDPSLRKVIKGVINIQGDMPFVGARGLQSVAAAFGNRTKDDPLYLLTLSQAWPSDQNYDEVGAVKVLADQFGRAIYFSRFPIPHSKISWKEMAPIGQLHIGVYGFTLESLSRFCAEKPAEIERAESLEQLRALWLGMPIFVLSTEVEAGASYRGIDVPQDLAWAREWARKETT